MKKIRLDQFTEYRFCSNLQAGPKPNTAAFVVTQANGDNGYDNHLWLLEDGQVRQLTSFNESNFIWEDEETLLFASLRDSKDKEALAAGEERTVFYRLNIHQGEARKVMTIPYTVTGFKRMKDSRLLLTIRYHLDYSRMAELPEQEKQALLKKKKEEQDYQIVSEAPYYFDGAGFTNGLRSRLAVWDPKRGTVDFPNLADLCGFRTGAGSGNQSGCFLGRGFHDGQRSEGRAVPAGSHDENDRLPDRTGPDEDQLRPGVLRCDSGCNERW